MALSYNSAPNIPTNTETNVASYTSASAFKVKGFIATGEAPGRFIIRGDGVSATVGSILAVYRTSVNDRTAYVVFPDLDFTANAKVYVNVVNEELDGAHNYEATLIYT